MPLGVTSAATTRAQTRPRAGLRLFATPAEAPRARRATDVLLVASASIALLLSSFAAVPQPGFSRAVATFLRSLPHLLDGLWQVLADSLALLALALFVAALVARRGGVARDGLLAAAVAVGVWLTVARWTLGTWPDAWESLRSADPPPEYPSPRLAIPAAVVIAVSPHMVLPIRRTGRWIVGLATVGVIALGASTPVGAVAGLLVAAIAASTVHLAFGSCGGRPGLEEVRAALAELGIQSSAVDAADRQPTGLFLVNARDDEGEPLVVKVYGRDAHDSALVATLWRTLWYREPGSPIRIGRLQQVEHEAFLTLLAQQAGVPTDRVVTAGATRQDDALLVLRPNGTPLAAADADDRASVAEALWPLVLRLREVGIVHGQLDDRHLLVVDGQLGLRDFRGATVAASDVQEHTDDVQAFVTSVLLTDEERASQAAMEALGRDGFEAMLPYLQPVAVTRRQRAQLRADDVDLDDVRDVAARVAGIEPPDLQQLRRVTLRSVLSLALPAIVAIALVLGVAGLDLERLGDALRDATWWIALAGFLMAQTPRVTQAISTLGASPVPLALGPVYALQLAVSYVNVAIPTAAARIAVNVRFFQRHGVAPGSALAVGALDSVAGLIVQVGVLTALLLFTPASLDLRLEGGAPSTAARLLALVVVLAVLAIAVVVIVPKLRAFAVHWTKRLYREALVAVKGLRSPRKVGLLLGGNLGSEVLFAMTLGAMVRALGFSVGLDELLLINISVALLSGLIPIPGGIGVAEGGLTLGLVRAGVPEEAAFAAVLMYRLGTFYAPPVWGFFALRWLERNKHL